MTPSLWIRHGGTQLKRFLGLEHKNKDVTFDDKYTYVQIGGKVAFRKEADEEEGVRDLLILYPSEPIQLKSRAMVVVNPDLSAHTAFNSQTILEPGEVPTVYIHDYSGTLEEMNLDWLFRIYLIR